MLAFVRQLSSAVYARISPGALDDCGERSGHPVTDSNPGRFRQPSTHAPRETQIGDERSILWTPGGKLNSSAALNFVGVYVYAWPQTRDGLPKLHTHACEAIRGILSCARTAAVLRVADTRHPAVQYVPSKRITLPAIPLSYCGHCLTLDRHPARANSSCRSPAAAAVGLRSSGYTSDWPSVSDRVRREADHRCGCCRLHVGAGAERYYLHVHHVNGDKGDNRQGNLRALCFACHAHQDARHYANLVAHSAGRETAAAFLRIYSEPAPCWTIPRS